MAAKAQTESQESIPIWRDVRYIAILLQILFVVVVVLLLNYLIQNMLEGLARQSVPLSFGFLEQAAGIPIGEGIEYSPSESYLKAFIVGIVNTLRIAVTGIVLSTLLGLIAGVARLSSNWLLRNIAYVYVEITRNIPVLLQLIFWFALTQAFPRTQDSINLFGLIHLTNRGVFLAWPRTSETFGNWLPWLVAALVIGAGVYIWRKRELDRQDRPGAVLPWALLALVLTALLGFIFLALTAGAPLYMDVPVLDRFNFKGGTGLTTNFFALLMGLTVYTGAFISEIVRAGILAVSKGQREAAKALGLSEGQSLRLIILPQALRIIIPPMTNQYLNLAKNSSLAIAIGYPDLFNIGYTIFNQTGQIIPMVLLIMLSYLTMSLLTSLVMNLYNRRIQIVER